MENETPPERRQGRARERQQRRRERQQHVSRPATRTTPRQINPVGKREIKVPRVNLAGNKNLLYMAAGAIFLVAIIVLLGMFKNDAPELEPNALWLGTEWTFESRSAEDMAVFVNRLRENRIGTVYAWVSFLKPDGEWSGKRDGTNEFSEVQPTVAEFVTQFKQAYPEVQLYGWVSVPTNTLGIPPRIGEEEVQQTVADFSQMVVNDLGFDGVFLNVEQVWNGDGDYLALLRQVRGTLGTDTPLSVAVPPDWSPLDADIPTPPLIVPGTAWSKEYKQSVAILADQLAVMAYNSGLSSADDYAEWMAYQVQAFGDAVAELGVGTTQLIIGIPTYAEELPGHDPNVENIASAVQGIRQGLAESEELADFVQGIAIYAEWETDADEWDEFKRQWVESS